MRRSLETTSEAADDIAESWLWYEDKQLGLGDEFVLEYDDVLQRIRSRPEMFPKVSERLRRANIRRFPFGVYYLLEQDRLIVVAVLHASRNPELWASRWRK